MAISRIIQYKMTTADLLHRTDMSLESINESLYKFQISNCINKVTISRINQSTGVTEDVEVGEA